MNNSSCLRSEGGNRGLMPRPPCNLQAQQTEPKTIMNGSRYLARTILIAAVLAFAQPGHAQSDSWVRKNDVGYNGQDGPRIGLGAPAFASSTHGYVIGTEGTLWKYDPQADAWTTSASFPGGSPVGWLGFAIGDKGYLFKLSSPTATWEYDPSLDSWSSKAPFTGTARNDPGGCAIGQKGYIAGGRTGTTLFNDLWEFDPVTDTWSQKADLPVSRGGIRAFGIDGKGYFTGGYSLNGGNPWYQSSTYEYDPAMNVWTQRAASGMAVGGGVCYTTGGKGYIATGFSGNSSFSYGRVYNPATDSWSGTGPFGDSAGKSGGFAFAVGGKGYIGGGRYYGDYTKRFNDFWEFDPATQVYTPRQYLGGMDLHKCGAVGIGGHGYFLAGGRDSDRGLSECWKYEPTTDNWSKILGLSMSREGMTVFAVGADLYSFGGLMQYSAYLSDCVRYRTETATWGSAPSIPGGNRANGVGFSVNGKGYVALGQNGATNRDDVQRYDPVTNTWAAMAPFPGGARREAVAFRIGNKVYVGTGLSNTLLRDMWMYDAATDTWTQKTDFGGTARRGAVAFTLGGKGYIATGDDGAKRKDVWEYDPILDSWTPRADLPGEGRSHAIAFTVGGKAYVGTGKTATAYAYDMWEYTAVDPVNAVQVRPITHLEGAYDSGAGIMGDELRQAGLLPLSEPYTAMGYAHAMSGGESMTPAVLSITGNDAIVDWVVVELRHSAQPSLVVASACVLVQRDGDVVDTDGVSPVRLFVGAGSYYLAIRHRNHLGAMTAATVALSPTSIAVDFRSAGLATFGTNARKSITGTFPVQALWAGDVTFNKVLQYVGEGNDRDPILVRVGGNTPTSTATGYHPEDVNLDGTVKYVGAGNDRDPILVNIGGSAPTSTRVEQLP